MFIRLEYLENLILFLEEKVFLLALDLALGGESIVELLKQDLRFHEIVLVHIDFDVIREIRHECWSTEYGGLLAVFELMGLFFMPRRCDFGVVSGGCVSSCCRSSCRRCIRYCDGCLLILLSDRVDLLHGLRLHVKDNNCKELRVPEVGGVVRVDGVGVWRGRVEVLLNDAIDLEFKVIRCDVGCFNRD